MVRIARQDTYGLEDTGGGVMVRRRIFAGKPIPDHLQVDGDAFEGEVDAPSAPGAEDAFVRSRATTIAEEAFKPEPKPARRTRRSSE